MAKRSRRPVDIVVGSRIKQAGHAAKISQTELGEALGVTFQLVQKYEKGSNRVSAGALQIIAERLKVPVSNCKTVYRLVKGLERAAPKRVAKVK